jgi:hypothetical protein
LIQRLFLGEGERSNGSLLQVAKNQRPNRNPQQPQNFNVQLLEQTPNVPILAFVDHHFDPAIALSAAHDPGGFHAEKITII